MNENNISNAAKCAAEAKSAADGCAARQSAHSLLQQQAEHLRRQAGHLHQEADRIEQLARWASNMNGPAEEALWRLAINGISSATPRPY